MNNQESVDNQVFSSYEEACGNDPDVERFDEKLQIRIGRVLSSMGGGGEEFSFSFDSLKEVTTSLLELDGDVMEVILEFKEDVWKSKEVFLLVKEFFDNSLATLEFCTAAESSIKNAKESQSFLQIALNSVPRGRDPNGNEIRSILSALELFRSASNPFGETFVEKFKAVYARHIEMLRRLGEQKKKLDRKLKQVSMWRKVSAILLGAAAAAVVICSIVAAAVASPPVAAALAAAASLPLGSMGSWAKSLWRKYEDEVKAERQLINDMQFRTKVVLHDLETINRLAASIQAEFKRILHDANFLDEHRDASALTLVVEDIASKSSCFMKALDDLLSHVDHVGKRIRQSRTIILQKIADYTKS
ncbi:hypothetical protein KP509_17G037200 [Ceratopteris richardii]|nr:hypothetical protein KP509_17G037200 [Ceratopteris richardii]